MEYWEKRGSSALKTPLKGNVWGKIIINNNLLPFRRITESFKEMRKGLQIMGDPTQKFHDSTIPFHDSINTRDQEHFAWHQPPFQTNIKVSTFPAQDICQLLLLFNHSHPVCP